MSKGDFGKELKRLRGKKGFVNQDSFSMAIGKTPSYVSKIENGNKFVRSPLEVLEIAEKLNVDPNQFYLQWLLELPLWQTELKEKEERLITKITDDLPISQNKNIVTKQKILTNFPEAFCPLAIVVGDKRERGTRIHSPGDILAYPASTADLKNIHILGLPKDTEIITDKVFMVKNRDEIKEILAGRNILCIGSPAANLVSREVNKRAFFRFNIEQSTLQHSELYQARLFTIKNSIEDLRKYQELKNIAIIHSITAQFHHGGLFNPIFDWPLSKRGFFQRALQDFAVISMAKNPYDDNTHAILVGGVHLVGTIASLRFLANKDNFKNHPVGGVIEVLERSEDFYERIKNPEVNWELVKNYDGKETKGDYDLDKLISQLDKWGKIAQKEPSENPMCSWERPEQYGGREINESEIIKKAKLELPHDDKEDTANFILVNEIPGCIRMLEKIQSQF